MSIELTGFTEKVDVSFWDLPGRENFITLNKMYLRDTNVVIIVYDVNS